MTDLATPRTADVAVIGSGIIGLSCAFHLREQGREVLMIDPSGFGNQTSHGNAGSISIGDVLPQSTPGVLMSGLGGSDLRSADGHPGATLSAELKSLLKRIGRLSLGGTLERARAREVLQVDRQRRIWN